MIKEILIFNFLIFMLSSCGESRSEKVIVEKVTAEKVASEQVAIEEVSPDKVKNDFSLPYDANAPSEKFKLPSALTEISGLAYSVSSKRLLAVNDEQGIIFALDVESGEIVDKIEFGNADDYEGIASHDGYIYIVESNGNIKVIKEENGTKIIEFDDRLSSDNDVEGICYDPHTETILIAAKGDSETKGNTKNVKSIFTMNIDNGAVRKKAYIQIDIKESYKKLNDQNEKIGVLKKISRSSRFRKYGPSGIAIDPISNLVYLLSSNTKSLAILDHDGSVKSIILLDKSIHKQPEGITFDKSGNMYISNEGKKGSAMLYKYGRLSN